MPLLGKGSWALVRAAEDGEPVAGGAGMDVDEGEGEDEDEDMDEDDCYGAPLPSDDDGGDSHDETLCG